MTGLRPESAFWLAIGLICAAAFIGMGLAAMGDHPPADPAPPAPEVRYVDCSHGAHVWMTSEGGIAVLPAGSACP